MNNINGHLSFDLVHEDIDAAALANGVPVLLTPWQKNVCGRAAAMHSFNSHMAELAGRTMIVCVAGYWE